MKWKRASRYIYLRFLRLRSTPEEISRGVAIGLFWGMFPLPGLQMLTAVVTAAIFKGDKLVAAAGTWLSNPLTTLPLTALNFHVGQWVRGRQFVDLPSGGWQSFNGFLELGSEFMISFLLGCLITGVIAGVAGYFLSIPIVHRLRRQAAKRRLQRSRSTN